MVTENEKWLCVKNEVAPNFTTIIQQSLKLGIVYNIITLNTRQRQRLWLYHYQWMAEDENENEDEKWQILPKMLDIKYKTPEEELKKINNNTKLWNNEEKNWDKKKCERMTLI